MGVLEILVGGARLKASISRCFLYTPESIVNSVHTCLRRFHFSLGVKRYHDGYVRVEERGSLFLRLPVFMALGGGC